MKNENLINGMLDNSEKEDVSGQLEHLGGDPAVALRRRSTADYHLPTFGSHGTKLGHS